MDFRIEYVPLIIGIVEAFKEFGAGGKWSIVVAVVVGMALSLGLDLLPEYTALALRGLMLSLAAAGLYRGGKRIGAAIGNGNGSSPGHG